jgi:polyisoprenoid-binding protein YceI
MKRLLALATVLAAPVAALAQSTWNIDTPHTVSSFSVRHMVIANVRGEFGKTTGTIVLDEKDVTKSTVEANIETATIDTRVADRDNHLRSPDFFDVAKYPAMTFKSTKVEKVGEGKLKVTGNLTIKGTTKPVVLEVAGPTQAIKDPWGNTRRGLSASTKINRQDFGLTWNKVLEAGPVVGDEIAITIEAEFVKQGPTQAAK